MEYWFIAYKFNDDLRNDMVAISKEESPNVNWYCFVDAVKRELFLTCCTFNATNIDDVVILNFIRVNKED